ncbi:MAG TPA: serine/threonine-protein kinase, partial [Kofleriaceae bacterium]|nr:serine/threonine-protein kinase [Kofleriaceae bacterium]
MSSPSSLAFEGTERFEVRRRIGAGAMGVVYAAFDRERGVEVALKTMTGTAPASLVRFKQEFRALAGISHPNLVALHELHVDDGVWFFTMELLKGVDLLTYVRGPADGPQDETSGSHDTRTLEPPPTRGEPDLPRLRSAIAQLALGVQALHAAQRLHRDIKPSNVMVSSEPRVVLLDFGIIAEVGAAGARGDVVGTPAYMAPEQADGAASPASDWYALGVVLFQLLTGARPFAGSGKAMLFDKSRYDAQPVAALAPEAPEDLASLCDALLCRDPAGRPTATDILRRLHVAASPGR